MWTSKSGNGSPRTGDGRRWALPVVLLAALLSAVVLPIRRPPRVVAAASGLYQVREIKPHVFVWLPEDIVDLEGDPEFARTGTAGFVVTAEGVAVVDTTNSPFHARELLYEIRQRTDEPVKYVIDTDSEPEYTLGNEVFSDLEAAILGSPGTQAEIKRYQQNVGRRLEGDWRLQTRMRGIHPTPPTQTVDTGTTLRLGGAEIRLSSFSTGLPGAAPTADTVAYLPAAKVAFAGGLVENGYYPRAAWGERGRDIRRWIEALKELETWDVDVYVPGHGAPATKREVVEFRQFLEGLVGEVEARVKQGKSLGETRLELLPGLESRHWHARELITELVEESYRQITAARTTPGDPTRPAAAPPPSPKP